MNNKYLFHVLFLFRIFYNVNRRRIPIRHYHRRLHRYHLLFNRKVILVPRHLHQPILHYKRKANSLMKQIIITIDH